ncbi:Variant-specific surface protein [Giardia duodenalis]|uniref:Variant-specific surface protein n=1 Tax=Giardia intestinalis TaxID=5741 RepID=V6TTT2_GIAIN|nr:Variant-specific surface protein [Giardia intestinalis]
MRGRVSRLVRQIVTALQLWCIYSSSDMDLHPPLGRCYNVSAAPGSGVRREARGGACVRYAEEVTDRTKEPRTNCQPNPSGGDGTCKVCGVHVSESEYCSQCNEDATYAPVNGQCADVSTEGQDKTLCPQHAAGKCTQCGGNSLLYMGGCYEASEGKPGHNLCTLASNGVCTEAAPGYFLNPLRASDKDSVVSCSDTTGFTDTDKTYKGVQYCEACDGSALTNAAGGTAKCTRCQEQKYLKGNECVADASACGTGYAAKEDSDSGNRCIKCDDAASGGIADCTQCAAITSPTRSGAPLVTCSQCTNSKKVQPDRKGCIDTCPDNSSETSGVCECTEGYTPDAAGTGCTQNTAPQCTTPGCKACDNPAKDSEVCTECNESKYLTPTSQCIDDCGKLGNYYGADDKTCKECTIVNCAECNTDGSCKTCCTGFYLDSKECKACDSSCKSCSGATAEDCTECPAGKILKYSGAEGQCIEQCVVNTDQASGNCKACDLTVEGTKYCSECSESDEYPQNGVCAPKATRAATCNDGTIQNGVCNACSAGYFRMNGGCYETSRYPGKSVCTTVASSGGTCQTAAPGYKVDGGTLVTCPEGCSACTSSTACTTCADGYVLVGTACSKCDASCLTCETSASTCKACASGYYKSNSKCIACDKSDGSITGVKGCASCAAPSGSTGPVLCYLVGMVLLAPSPHVPVGMSALLLVSHVSPAPCWVRRMVAERPQGSE